MTADIADFAAWQDEHLLDHRRRLRTAMFVSLAIHGLLLAAFAAAPPTPFAEPPEYFAVDLVAAPRGLPAPTPSRPKPAAPPAPEAAPSPPPPAAEPAAPEPPAPAPPIAKAPVQVLPEETPGRIREAKPAPEVAKPEPEVAKSAPETRPEPAPRPRRRREAAVSYEDAMAALEDELGGDDTAALLRAKDDAPEAAAESAGAPGPGVQVSPEQLAWDRKVISMISRQFIGLARYRGRGLVVRFQIDVAPDGSLRGEPRLLRTSGDLDYDRNALAAVLTGGPFPAPLRPGPRDLSLRADDVAR